MSQSGLRSSKLYLIPVNRFTTSELPHFKQKLVDHKHALSKLEANHDWQGVHQEQIKASSTLKKLRRSLQDLENVKSRLDASQQPDFEQRLIPVREHARKSIEDFAAFQQRVETAAAAAANMAAVSDFSESPVEQPARQDLLQRQLVMGEQELLHRRQEQLAAFETLERDAADLHEIFADLAKMTAEQREQVALVEEHVTAAQENVTEGARQLAMAARLSGGVAPVAGAVLGGLVAGPLGLFVGAKVGSVAAVGGGLLGYVGGRMVNTARSSGGPEIADPLPRAASAAASERDSPSAAPGALRWLRAALGRRLAPWFGRPCRLPEQPFDPLLAEDLETAEDAAAAAVTVTEPPVGEALLQPLPELVPRPAQL